MYGALFIMAGAYALSQDAHVRGDVVYRLSVQSGVPRQASTSCSTIILFFMPAVPSR